jgi:hypothetical protein
MGLLLLFHILGGDLPNRFGRSELSQRLQRPQELCRAIQTKRMGQRSIVTARRRPPFDWHFYLLAQQRLGRPPSYFSTAAGGRSARSCLTDAPKFSAPSSDFRVRSELLSAAEYFSRRLDAAPARRYFTNRLLNHLVKQQWRPTN